MELTIRETEVYSQPVDGLEWIIKKVSWEIVETIPEFLDPNGDPWMLARSGYTELGDVNSDTFTNYEDITEVQMKTWVTSSDEYTAAVNSINDEKNEILAPAIAIKDIPWENS